MRLSLVVPNATMSLSGRQGGSITMPPYDGRSHTIPEPQEIMAWLGRRRQLVAAQWQEPRYRILLGLLILGLALRLAYLDLIPFGSEQVRYLAGAQQTVRLAPPLAIPTADNRFSEPPLTSYLLALVQILNPDARLAAGFLATLGLGSILLLQAGARRHFGQRAALLFTGLACTCPWGILTARNVGPSALLLILSGGWTASLLAAIAGRSPWGWVSACVFLGAMLATSLEAIPLFFVLIILVAIYRDRVPWTHLFLGLCLLTLIMAPFLYSENLHRWSDLRQFLGGSGTANAGLRRIGHATAALCSSEAMLSLVRPSSQEFLLARRIPEAIGQLTRWLFFGSVLTVFGLLLSSWGRWRRSRDTAPYAIALCGLLVPLAGSMLRGTMPSEQALAVTLLPVLLVLGIGLDAIGSQISAWSNQREGFAWQALAAQALAATLGAIYLVLLVYQSYAVVYFYGFVGQQDCSAGYGIPYRYWRRAAALIRRVAAEDDLSQVWAISVNNAPGAGDIAPVLKHIVDTTPELAFLGDERGLAIPLPAERSMAYLVVGMHPPIEDTLSEMGDEQRGMVLFPNHALDMSVHVVAPKSVQEILSAVPKRDHRNMISGLQFIGSQVPARVAPGSPLVLTTYWTYHNVPSRARQGEHVLYIMLTQGGRAYNGQWYSFVAQERYWDEGLVVKQWNSLRIPATLPGGTYQVAMQAYRLGASPQSLGEPVYLGEVRISERP